MILSARIFRFAVFIVTVMFKISGQEQVKRLKTKAGAVPGTWHAAPFAFFLLPFYLSLPADGLAQASRRAEYGANLTVAIYQFDDQRSRKTDEVITLRQTVSTPEEEIEAVSRTYGIEEMKVRHIRAVGLAEGESFSDAQGLNEKLLSFTIVPRRITRDGVQFDFTARYDGKELIQSRGVQIGNYETVMLRGGQGEFGVKEFQGPNGIESVPQKRGLLVTITPTIIAVRGLQNRPSDLSRPTDQYGVAVRLAPDDVFVMPSVLTRLPLRFAAGSAPKGSITLQAVITPEGRVSNVRVLDSPDAGYNAKAIEVFRQFKFSPALFNGKPTWATWRETFVLRPPDLQ